MLKSDLKKAAIDYAEKYCGMSVKVTDIKADSIRYPMPYKSWSVTTTPKIEGFYGEIYDDYVFFGGACGGDKSGYLLDRKTKKFVIHNEDRPGSRRGLDSNMIFIYYFIFVTATIIYFILLRFDIKKTKK